MRSKKKLKKNLLKLVSVFLAIVLWVYLLSSELVTFQKNISLEVKTHEDLVVGNNLPKFVTFTIKGPRVFIKSVLNKNDKYTIDLSKHKKAKKLVHELNRNQIKLPFGMKIIDTSPISLDLKLEKKATRKLPVKLALTHPSPDYFKITNVRFSPRTVEVYGPRNYVRKLKSISIQPIDPEQLLNQNEIEVEVLLPDERLIITRGHTIKLSAKIKKAKPNLTIKDFPIKFINTPEDFRASQDQASLELLVPKMYLSKSSNLKEAIQIWADFPSEGDSPQFVKLRVMTPPDVYLINMNPDTVRIDWEE